MHFARLWPLFALFAGNSHSSILSLCSSKLWFPLQNPKIQASAKVLGICFPIFRAFQPLRHVEFWQLILKNRGGKLKSSRYRCEPGSNRAANMLQADSFIKRMPPDGATLARATCNLLASPCQGQCAQGTHITHTQRGLILASRP